MPKIPKKRLDGKVALVTGAGSGIGLAIARALAAEGCNLVITGRDHFKLSKAGRELARNKVRVFSMVFDVADPRTAQGQVEMTGKIFHRLDILVNNAGIAHANRTVQKLPYKDWLQVINTNLNGMFLVTHAALPLMKRGGAIVNNLSIAAKQAFPGSSAYVASKHGALGLTNALREELRPRGIRVIALLPGATDTDIWNTLWPKAPRQNMLSPKTVAEAVVNALLLPADGTAEELTILPAAGVL